MPEHCEGEWRLFLRQENAVVNWVQMKAYQDVEHDSHSDENLPTREVELINIR